MKLFDITVILIFLAYVIFMHLPFFHFLNIDSKCKDMFSWLWPYSIYWPIFAASTHIVRYVTSMQ